jgi:hypothetical protein
MLAQFGQMGQHGIAATAADDVTQEQNAHWNP